MDNMAFRRLKGSMYFPKVPNISQYWGIHCTSNWDYQLKGKFAHIWLKSQKTEPDL